MYPVKILSLILAISFYVSTATSSMAAGLWPAPPVKAERSLHTADTRAEERLQKLLRPHVYTGQQITSDVKAATGDPNITVFDRRHEFGEVYSCSYLFVQGKRAMVCE
jgi:hypothetical protein